MPRRLIHNIPGRENETALSVWEEDDSTYSLNIGDKTVPLVSKTISGDPGLVVEGELYPVGVNSDRSMLTIGGDHPYAQWWGSDGSNGMASMYLDLGIEAYIAICADESTDNTSGAGATLGKNGMLSVANAQALEQRGIEFISHGARHTHFWELLNTGIRVYYTGAEASPTVNISTTQLTTSTATTGATAFLFSTYPTLATLKTAINALSGWQCLLATELTGTEPSSALMPLNAARSNTPVADITNSCQRFAIAGGILIRYSGIAYRDVAISVNDGSNFFSLFADGARLLAQSTNTTLTALVTAINALNIVGLTALVMDNGYAAQSVAGSTTLNPGQKQRETYCFGDENGTALRRVGATQSIGRSGTAVTAGLGMAYALRRAIRSVKERASSDYGLTVDSFAQSGGRFYPWHLNTIADEHISWRGNKSFTGNYSGISPHAMPANHTGKFSGHFTSIISSSLSTPYSEADVKAVIDALGDSDGWYVNWLNHLCTPTPGDPSPYTGMNQNSPATYASGADQDEGPFYRELVYAAAARDAGKLYILPPTKAEKKRITLRPPSNLVFNPKFRNGRGNNLLGITSSVTGNGGIACPGWFVSSAAADYTGFSVVDNELILVTNGALGSSRTPIGSNLFLEPGKTYRIGAVLDLLGWGTANSVRFVLYPMHGGLGRSFNIAQPSILSQPWYGGSYCDAEFLFTVPTRRDPAPAYVRGIAGPFVFGGSDTLTINIDNRGASAAISMVGLTTAKAVAAAINTALATDAIYGTLMQYHNIATSVDNRLIVEAPNVNAGPNDAVSLMQINNVVGTPLVTLFGASVTTVRAASRAHYDLDSSMVGYRLAVLPSATATTQTLKLSAPFCREVKD